MISTTPSGDDTDTVVIGGERRRGLPYDLVSPSTGRVFARASAGSQADLDEAVTAARGALPRWRALGPEGRAPILHAVADAVDAASRELVELVARQNGMPVRVGRSSEGVVGPRLLRQYAQLAVEALAPRSRPRAGGGRTLVQREPHGVTAVIVPWNFPLSLALFKIAPALAAGNTVVWKPAPETVLDAARVAEIAAEAGLPAGVLSVVPGDREIGAALVAHPGVDRVAFTGSSGAGAAIAQECGRMLRPVGLELGGKSAAIVLDDADLLAHAQAFFGATLLNSGQTCYLSTRILLPRARAEEFTAQIAALVRALPIGDPLDPATALGPLVSRGHRERVRGFVERARTAGARVVQGTGAGALPVPDEGWYESPTVFADVDPASELAREEVFGPVLALTSYDSLEEALMLANDSDYGLAGTVWSQDEARAVEVASRVESGTCGVNGFRIDADAPFGGIRRSGIGVELGEEGLLETTRTRTIYASFADAASDSIPAST
ncbi:hypothetical protein NS220_08910 [Microbacterium testaceum]|uniref:Aldehyde dehydrogenase domain-containing protein n=1 Tax=Microbacterium testaceum TaxID=2033 RepID=A0A147EX38_MICTE|nr:aldehyde dehydrogenase family protein [Microbacterium testaceum]KTR94516.1 hypothetical protein NS220_08910 [Microbacterium testaceum]